MKQVLFILLAFISFQGFSQSVKVQEIGLEVMTKDLGKMEWEDATIACAQLGDRWRLPTLDELIKMYKYRDKIGGFEEFAYWSSSEGAIDRFAWVLYYNKEQNAYPDNKKFTSFVRAVRDLK